VVQVHTVLLWPPPHTDMADGKCSAREGTAGPSFWGEPGASAGEEMRTKLEAHGRLVDQAENEVRIPEFAEVASQISQESTPDVARATDTSSDVFVGPTDHESDWIDDFFSALDSAPGTSGVTVVAEGAAAELLSTSGPTCAEADDEPSESGVELFCMEDGGVEQHSGGAATPPDALNDWYDSDEDAISTASSSATETGPSITAIARASAFWRSASVLGRKASEFGSKAKKVIVEEAKLLVEDARDFSEGIREGMYLTAEDAKAMGERLKNEGKATASTIGSAQRPQEQRQGSSGSEATGECAVESIFGIDSDDEEDADADVFDAAATDGVLAMGREASRCSSELPAALARLQA